MPTHPGLPEQFGRYRILKKVGEGGMGAVYLAEDTQLGRRVAVKVPHFDEDEGPGVIERFRREARIAASIDHPNLCQVHDVGEVEGTHFFTMPFIEGTPLGRLLRASQFWPARQAVDLVRQIALAVGVLHHNGIIHRDLKPANIMIRKTGEPVLMDFGLARIVAAETRRLTRTGAPIGTPAYMSPEQVNGSRDVGPPSDVYSLGVILYELVTGQLPFDGPMLAAFAQILNAEPRPPSAIRPELDRQLDALCLQAMAKKPGDRFAGMNAFAAALAQYGREAPVPVAVAVREPTLVGTPAEARPAPPPPPPPADPRVICPGCGKSLKVPPALAGKAFKCPKCNSPLRSSAVTERASPAPPREETVPGGMLETTSQPGSTRPPPVWVRRRLMLGGIAGGALLVLSLVIWLALGSGPKGGAGPSAGGDGPAALRVLPISVQNILPGETRMLRVRVERTSCPGPVELRQGQADSGLAVKQALITSEEDEGEIEVSVEGGLASGKRTLRLLAIAGAARTEAVIEVTVRAPAVGKELDNSLRMKLVRISAGYFLMGAPDAEEGRFADEGPQHEVEITRDYLLGVKEVTVGQFREFVKATDYKTEAETDGLGGHGYNEKTNQFEGRKPIYTWKDPGWKQTDDHPVVNVTWNDAVKFCEWLGKKEGRTYDLPTEAEWEYACRAGTTTRYSSGDNTEELAQAGNVADASAGKKFTDFDFTLQADDGYPFTAPAGKFMANAWGLFDMHGNAWEWCRDGKRTYAAGAIKDPNGSGDGARRMLRGGSWHKNPINCRSALRHDAEPTMRHLDIGFRVVVRPDR